MKHTIKFSAAVMASAITMALAPSAMAAPPTLGALFTFSGTGASAGVNGSIYDKDIHSGVFGSANGNSSDSYVLQGGDPFGGDKLRHVRMNVAPA